MSSNPTIAWPVPHTCSHPFCRVCGNYVVPTKFWEAFRRVPSLRISNRLAGNTYGQ